MEKEFECLDRIDKRNYLTEREHKEFLGVIKQALIQAEQDKKKARYWDIIKEHLDFEFEETIKEYIKLVKDDNSKVISRVELYENINRIFGSIDKFLDIVEEDRPCCYISFKDEDDYVVIDSRAHRYISWYKHVGRDFDTDMETKEEVISFLERLHENWRKEYEEEGKV